MKLDVQLWPPGHPLPPEDFERLVAITLNYFPRPDVTRDMVARHLALSSATVLARRGGEIVGFGAAACLTRATPFAVRPLPLVFQRMLYVEPALIGRGIGARLQFATFGACLGPLWPLRPFVLVCRTLSAVVAKNLGKFTRSYPQHGVPVPPEVRAFAQSLLPLFEARALDERFCLAGGLAPFAGMDYSRIWRNYLRSGSARHDRLLLETMYLERDGRIINSGSVLMMIAYAAPLELFRGYVRRLAMRLGQHHGEGT